MRTHPSRATAAAVALLLAACSGATEPAEPSVQTLRAAQGDGRSQLVGTTIAVTVQARDDDSAYVRGALLAFTPDAGGTVSPATARSDELGLAETVWTLGTVSGAQHLAVTAGGATVVLTATATPDLPVAISRVEGDALSVATGAALPVRPMVRVADQYGNGVPGLTVRFTNTLGSGTVAGVQQYTDSLGRARVGGWTVSAQGAHQLTADVVATALSTVFSATVVTPGSAATIARYNGSTSGVVGYPVNVAPAVVVLDAGGVGVAGVVVTFTVAAGGGALLDSVRTTDASGIARVGAWTLGAGSNTVGATAAGLAGSPVTFSASSIAAGFTIEVVTAYPMPALDSAVVFWQRIIVSDLPDQAVSLGANDCGPASPALSRTVDDVLLVYLLVYLDGPGGAIAGAGPCVVREGSGLPAAGVVYVDASDASSLGDDGLATVLKHEIGHVLGFGSLWPQAPHFFLQRGGSSAPYFSGARAMAEFDHQYPNHATPDRVPVENTGERGTRDAHWREAVMGDELMTGYYDGPDAPASAVTLGSLADLGYVVNYAGSPATSCPSCARRAPSRRFAYRADVLAQPLRVVDRAGRVVRVIEP